LLRAALEHDWLERDLDDLRSLDRCARPVDSRGRGGTVEHVIILRSRAHLAGAARCKRSGEQCCTNYADARHALPAAYGLGKTPPMSRGVAAAIAVALAGTGLTAIAAPRLGLRAYGLPSAEPVALAMARACGARDLVLGLLVARSLGDRPVLRRTLAFTTLAALADAAAVASVRGLRPAHAFHLGGALALALSARA
jgi:hypothetical protein